MDTISKDPLKVRLEAPFAFVQMTADLTELASPPHHSGKLPCLQFGTNGCKNVWQHFFDKSLLLMGNCFCVVQMAKLPAQVSPSSFSLSLFSDMAECHPGYFKGNPRAAILPVAPPADPAMLKSHLCILQGANVPSFLLKMQSC